MGVSVRALDGVHGRPAAGLRVHFERDDDGWLPIATEETDADGRISAWIEAVLRRGEYRLLLDSDRYFVALGTVAAYPCVSAAFRVAHEPDTCRVEVVLAPSSYTVYIGTD